MKFQNLKYEYLFLFTFSWEKESLIGQQFFVGPVRDFFFSVKKKGKQIFLLQNLKFHQISKSTDDVHTTLNKNLTNFEQPLKNSITQLTLVVVQDVGGFSKLRVPLRSILQRSITHYIHTMYSALLCTYIRKVHPLT